MLYNLKQAVDWVQMGRTGEDASDFEAQCLQGRGLANWPTALLVA